MNTTNLIRHRSIAANIAAGLLAVAIMNPPPASAQITSAKVIAKGMACPFCAYGIEKKLGRVKGVTDVTVDLKSDTANLKIAKDAKLDLAAIQEAIREAGFTMGAVTITAVGSITEEDGYLALTVPGNQQKFLLFESSKNEGELHEGKKPALLTAPTERTLREATEEKATLKVTGQLHAHRQGPSGLQIDKFEVVK